MQITNHKPSLTVRIWPDDTIALVEDIREGEYRFKSDDYVDVDLYDFDNCETLRKQGYAVDQAIEEMIGEDPFVNHE